MSDDIIERLNTTINEMRVASIFESTALRAENDRLRNIISEGYAALSWSLLEGMDECISRTYPVEYKYVCDAAESMRKELGEEEG